MDWSFFSARASFSSSFNVVVEMFCQTYQLVDGTVLYMAQSLILLNSTGCIRTRMVYLPVVVRYIAWVRG